MRTRFERIFLRRTDFATLDCLLKRLHANRAELLMVLDRPERVRTSSAGVSTAARSTSLPGRPSWQRERQYRIVIHGGCGSARLTRRPPFWSIGDTAARITRLIDGLPDGATLAAFLPAVADPGATRDLRCRAALCATFVAGLELTRDGALALNQAMSWRSIHVRRRERHPHDRDGTPTTPAPA